MTHILYGKFRGNPRGNLECGSAHPSLLNYCNQYSSSWLSFIHNKLLKTQPPSHSSIDQPVFFCFFLWGGGGGDTNKQSFAKFVWRNVYGLNLILYFLPNQSNNSDISAMQIFAIGLRKVRALLGCCRHNLLAPVPIAFRKISSHRLLNFVSHWVSFLFFYIGF